MKLKYILLSIGILIVLTGCGGHEHSYTTERIEPTCVTVGYDVYTCECGHSYNEALDILEHTYTTSTSEDLCRTIYTCACGDTYEEDSYEVNTFESSTMYALNDIVTYNGPSEFYGVNEKTFAFNDEVIVTGTFHTWMQIDVDGTKLYIKEAQLSDVKYVEPEVQTAAKPTTPSKPQNNTLPDDFWASIGATVTTPESNAANFGGYTSQEDREKLDDGEFKDLIWN